MPRGVLGGVKQQAQDVRWNRDSANRSRIEQVSLGRLPKLREGVIDRDPVSATSARASVVSSVASRSRASASRCDGRQPLVACVGEESIEGAAQVAKMKAADAAPPGWRQRSMDSSAGAAARCRREPAPVRARPASAAGECLRWGRAARPRSSGMSSSGSFRGVTIALPARFNHASCDWTPAGRVSLRAGMKRIAARYPIAQRHSAARDRPRVRDGRAHGHRRGRRRAVPALRHRGSRRRHASRHQARDDACAQEAGRHALHAHPRTAELHRGRSPVLPADEFGVDADPVDEVLVTVGSGEALFIVFSSDGGAWRRVHPAQSDVPELCIPAESLGGVARFVPTTADFHLDVDAIDRAVTSRTKGVVICTPNNPTGAVYTREELTALLLCDAHNLIIIPDESYSQITYDGRRHCIDPVAAGGEWRARSWSTGLSKAYRDDRMAAGLCHRRADLIEQFEKIGYEIHGSVNTAVQYAGVVALRARSPTGGLLARPIRRPKRELDGRGPSAGGRRVPPAGGRIRGVPGGAGGFSTGRWRSRNTWCARRA